MVRIRRLDGVDDVGRREDDLAIVADDHVVADARGDGVGARAAKHDVVAVTGGDEIIATVGSRSGLGLAELEASQREEGQLAFVAQDDVTVLVLVATGPQEVAHGATNYDVGAEVGFDGVDAAVVRIGRLDGLDDVSRREDDLAVVADHDVIARSGGDAVGTGACDHHVVAVAGGYNVVAAIGRRGSFDLLELEARKREEGQLAFITQDDVARGVGVATGLEQVAHGAAHHDVGPEARLDVVDAAIGRVGRLDGVDDVGRREEDLAIVADDHVVARTGGDSVGTRAGEHDVVAVAGGDEVVAPVGRGRGLGLLELETGLSKEGQLAFVAEDDVARDVLVATGSQDVAQGAADHDVGAEASFDGVRTAIGRIGRFDGVDDVGRREDDPAVVADDDVVA